MPSAHIHFYIARPDLCVGFRCAETQLLGDFFRAHPLQEHAPDALPRPEFFEFFFVFLLSHLAFLVSRSYKSIKKPFIYSIENCPKISFSGFRDAGRDSIRDAVICFWRCIHMVLGRFSRDTIIIILLLKDIYYTVPFIVLFKLYNYVYPFTLIPLYPLYTVARLRDVDNGTVQIRTQDSACIPDLSVLKSQRAKRSSLCRAPLCNRARTCPSWETCTDRRLG